MRVPVSALRLFLLLAFSATALLGPLACDDPLSMMKAKAKDGGKMAAAEDYADDEEAKRKAGGVSIGPGEAKRLYYQFIDGRGRVAFVERLTDVPSQWRDKVGFVEMDSPPPLSPAMAQQTRDAKYGAAADQIRMAANAKRRNASKPILYTADWCGWCKKAKKHLDATGADYVMRDIDIPANLDELVAKTGQRGIPVLDVGGRIVTGFSPDEYDQLLRGRG